MATVSFVDLSGVGAGDVKEALKTGFSEPVQNTFVSEFYIGYVFKI